MTEATYDVLSPWAETDPLALQGISPRLPQLRGRRIGLFANYKRAAVPIQDAVEDELRTRYGGDIVISRFVQSGSSDAGGSPEDGPRYAEWLEEVDAVVVAVGD